MKVGTTLVRNTTKHKKVMLNATNKVSRKKHTQKKKLHGMATVGTRLLLALGVRASSIAKCSQSSGVSADTVVEYTRGRPAHVNCPRALSPPGPDGRPALASRRTARDALKRRKDENSRI